MSSYASPLVLGRPGAESHYKRVIGPDPAAGTEVLLTCPAAEVWEILSMTLRLTASIVAGNRSVEIVADDGNEEIWRWYIGRDVAASADVRFTGIPGIFPAAGGAGPEQQGTWMPSMVMFPGWRLRTVTQALDVGDEWHPPILGVRWTPLRGESAAIAFELAEMLVEQLNLEEVTEAMLRRS